jgi:Zn-finger nucleic acid-binding protein
MVLVKVGGCLLTECTACGGLWVDKPTFETICADREEQTAVLGRPASPVPHEGKASGNRRVYIACPACGELMNRVNFAACSGVLIDWCKPHGIWFDHSELARIVRFIHEGGLKKSREREKEQLQEELRREREKQRELLRLERMGKRASAPDRLDWAGDSRPLLDFLSSVWKGMPD